MVASTPCVAIPAAQVTARPRRRDLEFRELYLAEFGHLSGYCAGLVGDHQVGCELAQEAFTRLYASWVRVRDPASYVFRIATNVAHDHWRRSLSERSALSSVVVLAETMTPAMEPPLLDVVERLPRPLRDVVLMHYYGDLSVEQVAHATRRPVGTVKRQLHDARRLLHARLGASR